MPIKGAADQGVFFWECLSSKGENSIKYLKVINVKAWELKLQQYLEYCSNTLLAVVLGVYFPFLPADVINRAKLLQIEIYIEYC